MAKLIPVLAALSLVAQVLFFVGFGFMLFDLFTFPEEIIAIGEDDSSLLVPYIEETVLSYGPALGIGVIGAFVAWILILKALYRSSWFLQISRILAWIWMPFIPIGTLIGVLLLSSRSVALQAQEAT